MIKIKGKNTTRATDIEEAYVLTPQNRVIQRYAVLLTVLIAAVVLAGAWATNHFYIEPTGDAALVSKALQQLESTGIGKEKVEELTRRNAPDRAAKTYQMLRPSAGDSGDRDRIDGYLAALRIAMRAGIPEAKLSYGMALRDGLTGKRNSAAALKIFDEVDREMEPGLRAGDPVALYVVARMFKEGLGKQPDPQKAIDFAKRAVGGLDGWRLEASGYDLALGFDDGLFKGYSDTDLLAKIATRLIDQKSESGPDIGSFSCAETDTVKRTLCMKGWYERGVNNGIDSAVPVFASYLIKTGEPLENIDRWFAQGNKYSSPYYRYRHAVVKAMLATDNIALLSALSEMRKQILADEKGLGGLSLPGGMFVLHDFGATIAGQKPNTVDNFLIAINVSGIFTDSLESNQKNLQSDLERPDLLIKAKSPEIMRKSEAAARAILDGVPLTEIKPSILAKTAKSANTAPVELSQSSPVWRPEKNVGAAQSVARDPEQQDTTGYLRGQPRAAVGGLSTFTVDNRQGGKDAVARIYLHGKKPAVRSMYVKHGETFKADAILPGTYVFRYRFIGGEDTFESDKDFPLTQTETETGTRYSNVTVTLFKVKDGNMSSRKVDPNSF